MSSTYLSPKRICHGYHSERIRQFLREALRFESEWYRRKKEGINPLHESALCVAPARFNHAHGSAQPELPFVHPLDPRPPKRGLGVTFPAPESHNRAETKPLGAAPCSPGEPINKLHAPGTTH